MSDESEDRKHADNEQAAQDAAERISERGARHFPGDPELARAFREWDE